MTQRRETRRSTAQHSASRQRRERYTRKGATYLVGDLFGAHLEARDDRLLGQHEDEQRDLPATATHSDTHTDTDRVSKEGHRDAESVGEERTWRAWRRPWRRSKWAAVPWRPASLIFFLNSATTALPRWMPSCAHGGCQSSSTLQQHTDQEKHDQRLNARVSKRAAARWAPRTFQSPLRRPGG